jgi:hypothetical protein
MKTNRLHARVATIAFAIVLSIQISPAQADDDRNDDCRNRPVRITFTKWGAPAPNPPPPPTTPPSPFYGLFQGFFNDGPVGSFVAEVLWRQTSVNGHVTGLEALYEVVHEDPNRSFSALIRGGQNAAGAAQLDGVILAGWRTGASVHVRFQRYNAIEGAASCDGAPLNTRCFVGTIYVGRDPRD